MSPRTGATSPTSLDLRSQVLPIKDQGPRGTCLAFTATAAHEMQRFSETARLEDLAEEVLYWGCKQADGDHVSGTSFLSASYAMTVWGQPDEGLWPYDPLRNDADETYQPPTKSLDHRSCYKAVLSQIATDTNTIKNHLLANQSVMLGIPISLTFMTVRDGLIELPGPLELLDEGHAVLIVGYDDTVGATGAWLIRNSWGAGWGRGGYAYLPYRYIGQYGGEAWVVASSDPQPQRSIARHTASATSPVEPTDR